MRPLPTLLPLPLRQFAANVLRRLQRDLIAPMRFLLMLLIPLSLFDAIYRLQNWFLLNLARHADHHAHAAKRYQELRHIESAPQLPGGYGAMVLLALIPPLWFRVIHPRMASGAWSESMNKQKPILTNEDRAAD